MYRIWFKDGGSVKLNEPSIKGFYYYLGLYNFSEENTEKENILFCIEIEINRRRSLHFLLMNVNLCWYGIIQPLTLSVIARGIAVERLDW